MVAGLGLSTTKWVSVKVKNRTLTYVVPYAMSGMEGMGKGKNLDMAL